MLPREVLRQIRRLQLRARRAVEDLLGGEYHSIFKGTGINFEEVRAYQPGDEIRTIDWNVTARMGQPYIKRFIEERELTVMLVVDSSGSQDFGSGDQKKRDIAAELAAVLAFSAISNNDRVGLLQFTDEVENHVPASKGTRHVLRLIRDILFYRPQKKKTDLAQALDYLNRVTRRRIIVFVLSDFLDDNYEQAFKRAGRRHDLIAIRIFDPLEKSLPSVGLAHLEDAETGQQQLMDARLFDEQIFQARRDALVQLTRSAGCDLVEVTTEGNEGQHLDALVRFFRLRQRRQRRR